MLALPERKENMLDIEYNLPAQFKFFSMLQAHCGFMEVLFQSDPYLDLISKELDNQPITMIEKFSSTGEQLCCFEKSKINPHQSSKTIVIQKILMSIDVNKMKFGDGMIPNTYVTIRVG